MQKSTFREKVEKAIAVFLDKLPEGEIPDLGNTVEELNDHLAGSFDGESEILDDEAGAENR